MAKVPIVSQDVRMRPTNPVEIGSTAFTRMPGEALAGVGEGAKALGFGVMEFDKRKKSEMDNIQAEAYQNAVRDGFDQLMLETEQDANVAKAPVLETLNNFNTKANKIMEDTAVKLGIDGVALLKGKNKANDSRLKAAGWVKQFAMQSSIAYIEKQYDAMANQTKLKIFNEPAKWQEHASDLANNLNESPTVNPAAKAAYINTVGPEIFQTALDGYVAQGKFKAARDHLRKHGTHLNAEGLNKAMDMVGNEEATYLNRQWEARSKAKIIQKEEQEKIIAQNDSAAVRKLYEMDSTGKNYDALVKEVSIARADGLVSPVVESIVNAYAKKVDEETSDKTAYPYYAKIYNGGNLDTISEQLDSDVSKEFIRYDRGAELQTLINGARKARRTRTPEQTQGESVAKEYIRSHFEKSMFDSLDPGKLAKQRAEAMKTWFELYTLNPRYTGDPVGAAVAALYKTVGRDKVKLTINGFPAEAMSSIEAIDKQLQFNAELYRKKKVSGKVTPGETEAYMVQLRQAAEVKDILRLEKETTKIIKEQKQNTKNNKEKDKDGMMGTLWKSVFGGREVYEEGRE
jgi:hypothetical protein